MEPGGLRNMKIVINGEASLKKWSRILDCQEKDLIYAINNIGNSAGAVDDYLYMNLKKKSIWEKYNQD
jgi:succinate dehydrogenase flavin-adding protein (antitoxin of CptAB toxin-antitoxin module)